jgi:deoxyribodipyrimidine photo-lyase
MSICVWFKKDLRINDHEPLLTASSKGTVIPLYIIEPEIIYSDQFGSLHWNFIRQSLVELNQKLTLLGQPLIIKKGEAVEVLQNLQKEISFDCIYSHEETGNAITFGRDKRVRGWANNQNILWKEFTQNGVVRGLHNRDGWSRMWEERMKRDILPAPNRLKKISPSIRSLTLPNSEDLGIINQKNRPDLVGGESKAMDVLDSFISHRGLKYYKEMSSPNSAYESCSRISPYLTNGCISMKQIVNTVKDGDKNKILKSSTRSFLARCHWHCHFMQKLESEPQIETNCFHPSFDNLRNNFNEVYFDAWKKGETGYPFVDACMRALKETGWINFRMRAMLVSFISYNLWIDWRKFKNFLACNFIDYEPGIHYSQIQMQSGVTGINALRMYNPIKQGYDHDPNGEFIKRWVPELSKLEGNDIHEPWLIPGLIGHEKRFKLGSNYPFPIVNLKESISVARQHFKNVRQTKNFREISNEVFIKHGSRKKR